MKFNFVGLLCSLFLLAACHSDDNEPILADDEPQAVTLTINLEDAYTRTISEDKDNALTRLLIQMVDDDVLQTDIKTINLTSGQTTATASYELYASHRYTFLLWADDGSYNATDLTNITLKDNLTDTQAGLSYAAKATWDGTSATISTTLNHVASKVTLKATNKLEAGNTLTLTVPQAYSGYNVQDATITGEAEAYPHTYTTTAVSGTQEQPVELFSFYVLAANALQNLTVSCNNETATVPANLGGGKHIILKGDISTQEQPHSTSLSVSIGGWSDLELPFGGTDQLTDDTQASGSLQGSGTPEDPYRITSAADLLCYMDDYASTGMHAILYTDIEINRTNWQPVSLSGTFDGGNHTISGTMTINALDGSAGLFNTVINSTVRNLIMDVEMTVTGSSDTSICTGSIAGGATNGTFENCVNHGDINASDTTAQNDNSTGGIVGNTTAGKVSGCTNTGKVTGGEGSRVYVGGIVGSATGTELSDNHFDQGTPNTETGNWW